MMMTVGPRMRSIVRMMTMPQHIFSGVERLTKIAGTMSAGRFAMLLRFGGWIGAGIAVVKWIYDKSLALMQAANQDRIQAITSGTTIGGLRAYRALFWMMPDDPKLMGIMSTIRAMQGSKEAIAIQGVLGVKIEQDSVNVLVQSLLAAQQFLRQFPGQELQAAEQFGLPQDPQTTLALKEQDPARLRQRATEMVRLRRSLEFSQRQQLNISEFLFARNALLTAISVEFQKIIVNSGMADFLTKLSRFLTKEIGKQPDTPKPSVVRKPHKKVEVPHLKEFANWLDTEASSTIKDITRKFDKFNEDISGYIKKFKAARRALDSIALVSPAEAAPGHPGRAAFARRLATATRSPAPEPVAVPGGTLPEIVVKPQRRLGPREAGAPPDARRRLGQPPAAPTGIRPEPATSPGRTTNAPAPSGDGGRYPRMAEIKAATKEQLMKEGLTDQQAESASNVLVGQAIAESGLRSQYHDQGKSSGAAGGYVPSIYGADRARGQAMVGWITAQGGDPRDPVWQGRYMAHESMTGRYPRTQRAFRSGDQDAAADAATQEYEAPATRYSPYTLAERRRNARIAAGAGQPPSQPAPAQRPIPGAVAPAARPAPAAATAAQPARQPMPPPPAGVRGLPGGPSGPAVIRGGGDGAFHQFGRADVDNAIANASKSSGLSRSYLAGVASIESGGDPKQGTGKYKGLFQLSEQEFRDLGGQGSVFDPAENARIAASKMKREADSVSKQLGRPLTDSEMYLVHQQGTAGAFQHLTHPDQPAWKSMFATGEGQAKGEAWSKKAIWGNIPNAQKQRFGNVDNVTSRQFTEMWSQRYLREPGTTDQPGVMPEVTDPYRHGVVASGLPGTPSGPAPDHPIVNMAQVRTATGAQVPPSALTPERTLAPAAGATKTMLFIPGMYSRYQGRPPAEIEASARKYAAANGYKLEVIPISGDDKAGQLSAARTRLQQGGVDAVYGFSQGGFAADHLRKDYPGLNYTIIGAPGVEGNLDHSLGDPHHMDLPGALASRTPAGGSQPKSDEEHEALVQYHMGEHYPTSTSGSRTGGQEANLRRMAPEYLQRAKEAREELKAAGLGSYSGQQTGPWSTFRDPRLGVNSGRHWSSNESMHGSTTASDWSGVPPDGSPDYKRFAAIMAKHGFVRPWGSSTEWNHWQLTSQKAMTPEQQKIRDTAMRTGDYRPLWKAMGAEGTASEQPPPSKDIKTKKADDPRQPSNMLDPDYVKNYRATAKSESTFAQRSIKVENRSSKDVTQDGPRHRPIIHHDPAPSQGDGASVQGAGTAL